MDQNVLEKVAENLDFVENSNLIRESTETAIFRCSGIYSQESTRGGALL